MKEKREKILPKAHSARFFLYCNVVQIILLSVSAEYYITLNITVTSSGLQLCVNCLYWRLFPCISLKWNLDRSLESESCLSLAETI